MKHILLLIFALAFSVNSKSQVNSIEKDTIYIDENNQIIDKRVFNFKQNSSIFYGLRFKNDTIVLNKLRYTHLFGEISEVVKSQLFKLISSRNDVDTTKIIVIHYIDTLKNIDEFPKKNIIIYSKDSLTHKHLYSHKNFILNHKNCVKKYKKNKKANVYHFYKINNGHPENYKKYSWQKDHFKLISSLFKDSYKRFNIIILNPNGSFFCFNYKKNNMLVYNDIIKIKNGLNIKMILQKD